MTEYVVFHRRTQEGVERHQWMELGTFAARNPKKAIEAALVAWPDDLNGAEHFSASPARSWKPVTVKVETKTALKFS